MPVGITGLHFKIADFIRLVNFEYYSQNEFGHIAILVLWRVCENSCGIATINLVMWQAGNGQQLCCKILSILLTSLNWNVLSVLIVPSILVHSMSRTFMELVPITHNIVDICYCQYNIFALFYHRNARFLWTVFAFLLKYLLKNWSL